MKILNPSLPKGSEVKGSEVKGSEVKGSVKSTMMVP